MGTAQIITMASIGVATVLGEKLLNECGKPNLAQMLSISGYAALAITAVTMIIKFLSICKGL